MKDGFPTRIEKKSRWLVDASTPERKKEKKKTWNESTRTIECKCQPNTRLRTTQAGCTNRKILTTKMESYQLHSCHIQFNQLYANSVTVLMWEKSGKPEKQTTRIFLITLSSTFVLVGILVIILQQRLHCSFYLHTHSHTQFLLYRKIWMN